MAVRKFRTITEMNAAGPLSRLDPDNIRIACELTELGYAFRPWHFPPGVTRFRDMTEANRRREEWLKRQVRRAS